MTNRHIHPFLIVLFILFCGGALRAQDTGFGLGIMAGDPTGISAKLWLGGQSAIDAAVAWSFRDPPAIHIHGDYLFHGGVPVDLSDGVLMFHFGVGGRVKLEDETRIGVRVPIGVDYWFDNYPVDVFLEAAAILDLVPATEFDLNAAIGIRYFFTTR
jgi:hypothetical protein